MGKFSSGIYRICDRLVKALYPVTECVGAENLPEESCVIIGNHCQMHGPIVSQLYMPRAACTWCASEMMELKEVPDYAFQDFWSKKPVYIRWFFRLASYVIAPLSVALFGNADVIPVYKDRRIINTFRLSVDALNSGRDVVIFPECNVPHNNIVYEFQEGFVTVAKEFYKKTGKIISFVPMYLAPALKKIYLGKPIRYNPDAEPAAERKRICAELMDAITGLAASLPLHKAVPYPNCKKKDYPDNIPITYTTGENS